MLGATLAAALLGLAPSATSAAIDRTHAQTRRGVERWLEARLGFAVSFEESELVSEGRARWLFALVAQEQANRVACSELVSEPDTACVALNGDPDISTLVIARAGADLEREPPLVVWLPTLEDEPGESVDLEDVARVELDGDAAREIAVVFRTDSGASTGSTHLFVLDDDGQTLLERSLSECESGMGDEDEGSCEHAFAYVSDPDGDGRAAIAIVDGVESDAALAAWIEARMGGGDEYSESGESLENVGTDFYEWSDQTRRLESR